MKLGTRVFVQGLTKDGLADKEGVSQNASVCVHRRSTIRKTRTFSSTLNLEPFIFKIGLIEY